MKNLKQSIATHLRRRAAYGQWVYQRKLRNSIHADSAELFNRAVVELAMEGVIELEITGHRKKLLRLKVD